MSSNTTTTGIASASASASASTTPPRDRPRLGDKGTSQAPLLGRMMKRSHGHHKSLSRGTLSDLTSKIMVRRSDDCDNYGGPAGEGTMRDDLVDLHWNDDGIPSPYSVADVSSALDHDDHRNNNAGGGGGKAHSSASAPSTPKRSLFSSKSETPAGGRTPKGGRSMLPWKPRGSKKATAAPATPTRGLDDALPMVRSNTYGSGASVESAGTINAALRKFGVSDVAEALPPGQASSSPVMDTTNNSNYSNPSLGNSVDFLSLAGPSALRHEELSITTGGTGVASPVRNPSGVLESREGGAPPASSLARDRLRDTIDCTFHLKYPASSIMADSSSNADENENPNEADGSGAKSPARSIASSSGCAAPAHTTAHASQSLYEINQTNESAVTTLCSTPGRRGGRNATTGPVDVDEVVFVDAEQNLRSILRLAREHVVLKEYDDAAEVYSRLLVNQRASLERLRGKHKSGGVGITGRDRHRKHLNGECQRVLQMWVGTTLHNLAVTSNLRGHYDKAVHYASEAVSLRRALGQRSEGVGGSAGAANAIVLAESLTELGLAHYARGEFSGALNALREGLQRMCQRLPYDTTPAVAKVLNAIGCVHVEMGQLLAALATFGESLDIQRSALSAAAVADSAEEESFSPSRRPKQQDEEGAATTCLSSTDSDFTLLNVSTTLCNIGFVHWKQRGIDQSISSFEEALMLQESVLGDAGDYGGGGRGSGMIQHTSGFIAFLTDIQENLEARSLDGGGAGGDVDGGGDWRSVDGDDDRPRAASSPRSPDPSATAGLRRTYAAERAVSFMTSFKGQGQQQQPDSGSTGGSLDGEGAAGGQHDGGANNPDLVITVSTHYIFHSVQCLSLGPIEAPPAAAAEKELPPKKSRSGANRVQQHHHHHHQPKTDHRRECQARLRRSIQYCLKMHGSQMEEAAADLLGGGPSSQSAPPGPGEESRSLTSDMSSPPRSQGTSSEPASPATTTTTTMPDNFPAIHARAVRHLLAGEYTEALMLYQNVLLTLQRQSVLSHDDEGFAGVAGMAFHHLGVIFLYAEEYEDAKKMFHKAGEFRVMSCQRFSADHHGAGADDGGSSSTVVEAKVTAHFAAAVSLANLAISHFLLSQYEDAVIYFSQSLRFLRQLPPSAWIDTHIARVWNDVACTHVCVGRAGSRSALSAFDVALSSCGYALPGANGDDDGGDEGAAGDVNGVRATVLTNRGHLQVRLGDYAGAIVTLQEALQCINHVDRVDEKETVVQNLAYAMAAKSQTRDEGKDGLKRRVEMYKEMLKSEQYEGEV